MRQVANEELVTVRMSHNSSGSTSLFAHQPHGLVWVLWGGTFVSLSPHPLWSLWGSWSGIWDSGLDSGQGCEAGTLPTCEGIPVTGTAPLGGRFLMGHRCPRKGSPSPPALSGLCLLVLRRTLLNILRSSFFQYWLRLFLLDFRYRFLLWSWFRFRLWFSNSFF